MLIKTTIVVLISWCLNFIVLIPVTPAQSTEVPEISSDQFNFSFDMGFFRAQDGFVLVELYYSIFRNYLKFIPDEYGWKATFNFQAEIWANDSLLARDQWTNLDHVDSLGQITPAQKLFGMGFFAVKPGSYLIKVALSDINSNMQQQKEQPLVINPIPVDTLYVSDIELATQIRSSTEKNRFYKNGYTVIPNPDQFYGTGLPMLMFYAEIYNLMNESRSDSGDYSVQYRILDGDGQTVREFPAKIRKKPGESAVEASGMNIISFHSGTYFLQLEAVDLVTGEKAISKKKFFIYREGDMAISDSASQKLAEEKLKATMERIYKSMSTGELDEEFNSASYIATPEEKNIFKKLDAQGKQSFMIEFWKKRDTTPTTPQNEFRDNYLKLVNTANKEFSGFKKGWQTDQGRILLVYGVPDEIERIPLSMESKAHQIWKYFSIQGGVIFVFVDKQGFGQLELVHSTARGELSDSEWERWITPNR